MRPGPAGRLLLDCTAAWQQVRPADQTRALKNNLSSSYTARWRGGWGVGGVRARSSACEHDTAPLRARYIAFDLTNDAACHALALGTRPATLAAACIDGAHST